MGHSLWADRVTLEDTPSEVVAAISGANLLLERFGTWPTFADFEILALQFDRGNLMEIFETGAWSKKIAPSLVAVIYGFDARFPPGHPQLKRCSITMKFDGLAGRFAFDGFNHQNPICGLAITFEYSDNLKKNLFAVDWGGTCLLHDVSFTCERVQVISVEEFV